MENFNFDHLPSVTSDGDEAERAEYLKTLFKLDLKPELCDCTSCSAVRSEIAINDIKEAKENAPEGTELDTIIRWMPNTSKLEGIDDEMAGFCAYRTAVKEHPFNFIAVHDALLMSIINPQAKILFDVAFDESKPIAVYVNDEGWTFGVIGE